MQTMTENFQKVQELSALYDCAHGAGLAVVMENGLDSMKAIADYITVSNQENGVAKAMEKFVLR